MNIASLSIIASATCAYAIWIYQTLWSSKSNEGPSFASMLLWSIIDSIMWWSTIRAVNDQTLIATYTILTIALTLILIAKKKYGWTQTDWFVAVVAFACLIISYLVPPIIAVIAGALSISSAGIPFLIGLTKLKQKPSKFLYWTIAFFMIGPLLTLIKTYNVNGELKEYFYPSIAIIYWSIACCIALYKKFKLKSPVFY